MKNNEKYTVGYSVLNPATNSDSDSTKSNGARGSCWIIHGEIRKVETIFIPSSSILIEVG